MEQASLKSFDIVLLCHIRLRPKGWTQDDLAYELNMVKSAVNRSLKRSANSKLYRYGDREVNVHSLIEFINHGFKYAFPVLRGGIAMGIPTAHSAPPLSEEISVAESSIPLVWPSVKKGVVRGESIFPIISRPAIERIYSDPNLKSLYQVLALIDSIRIGNAREQELARKFIAEILNKGYHDANI